MGRGTSSMRSVVPGSPKKPSQEHMDINSVSAGDLTPMRKPLSSISESCRNSDESSADAGKLDGTTPKGKKRRGPCLFPHLENVEGTPERHGNGKSKKAHSHHQSSLKSQPASRLQDVSPAEPALKHGAAQGPAAAGSSTSRALVPLPGGGRNASQVTSEQQFNLEEDPTFWLDHNVQVLIRTRPVNGTEVVSQGFSKCLRQESPHTLTWVGPPETRFTFDNVAGEFISQEKLFNVAGVPMVENCMAGYNSCMFAYGQTGSGKTHTMLGDIEHLGDRPSDNRGMTPRVFEYLFSRIHLEEERRKDENLKFLTKCSFLEIYNEQITDLLEPTSTNLQMREDVRKGVYVENLTEVEVNSVQDVIQLLSQGSANRKVAATNMNRESSRSHSVFTCIIESRWERDSMTNIRFGRLNLVDLAGSERQKTSGAEGERLKEAANINKSLSTLGLVIMILVDVANGKQRHVPYRDSKLTFLLQDSLGGNSKTTIIATVSPSSCNALETLSTLKFAQRAKLIRNMAVINEDASGDVKALRAQIQQMKEELDRLRRQSISRIPLSQDDFNPVRGSFDSWGDAHKFFGSPQVSSRKVGGIAHRENLKLKEEESVKDLTRSQAESETVLAMTSMQAEFVNLKTEVEVAGKELAAAKGAVSELTSEVDSMRMMLSDVKYENLQAIEKYESMLRVKDCEIEAHEKDWQCASVKLIDYLAEGDQALNEASLEMEQIFCGYLPSTARSRRDSMNHSRMNGKRKAVGLLKQQLQHAQELVKDTEGRVLVLSEAAFATASAQAPETPQEVHLRRTRASEELEVLQGEVDSSRRKLVELERNAAVMSVVMMWLSESMEAKDMAGSTAHAELRETKLVMKEKERLLSQLRNAQEADQSLLRESEDKVRQLSNDLEESNRWAAELSVELFEREASLEVAPRDLELVQMKLMDVSDDNSTPREEMAAAKCKCEAGAESIDSMNKAIGELKKSRVDKEEEYDLLLERLEMARVKRMEAQEKLDALTVVMHEVSGSEMSWKNERDSIVSGMEVMRSRMAEKGAEVVALQEVKRALETRLQSVAGDKDAALATIASLENRSGKLEASGKCAGKDGSSGSDEVELANARAALAGAEEKVKLLVDENATMTVEWEGERSWLNADKELLQLEISREEKPGLSVSDQERCTSEDGESGKDHLMDELKQVVKRSSAECEKLRSQLRIEIQEDIGRMTGLSGSNVSAYVGMVNEVLRITSPKAVTHCQVREAKRSLLDVFYTQIGKTEGKRLAQILDEDPALMERRQACAKRLELYKNARDEIDSVAWAK